MITRIATNLHYQVIWIILDNGPAFGWFSAAAKLARSQVFEPIIKFYQDYLRADNEPLITKPEKPDNG